MKNQNMKNQKANRPNLQVARLPVTFHAGDGFVNAVFHIEKSTIGVRFESPEQILEFFEQLMNKAAQTWPDNQWIQMWSEED